MEFLTESINECSVARVALPKMNLAKEMPCPTEAAPSIKVMLMKEDESEIPKDGGTIHNEDSVIMDPFRSTLTLDIEAAELCLIHFSRQKLYRNKLRCNRPAMAVAFRKEKRNNPKVWKNKRIKRGAVT